MRVPVDDVSLVSQRFVTLLVVPYFNEICYIRLYPKLEKHEEITMTRNHFFVLGGLFIFLSVGLLIQVDRQSIREALSEAFPLTDTLWAVFQIDESMEDRRVESYESNDISMEDIRLVESSSWVPSGFKYFKNDIAYKWSDHSSFTCDYESCQQIEIVSKNGCKSLYAEVNKLDSENNNVGYTNASTTNLAAGQKALLMFRSTGDFKSFTLSEISCY